jgi:hypothetical protein
MLPREMTLSPKKTLTKAALTFEAVLSLRIAWLLAPEF